MTPIDKAKELVEKFYDETPNAAWFNEPVGISKPYNARELAKNCALIAVDEIIAACPIELVGNTGKFRYTEEYWQQVKQAIQSL